MGSSVCKSQILDDLVKSFLVGLSSVQHVRQHDVLIDVKLRKEIIELIYKSDVSSSEDRELVLALGMNISAVDKDFSRSRLINSADDVKERRLA